MEWRREHINFASTGCHTRAIGSGHRTEAALNPVLNPGRPHDVSCGMGTKSAHMVDPNLRVGALSTHKHNPMEGWIT